MSFFALTYRKINRDRMPSGRTETRRLVSRVLCALRSAERRFSRLVESWHAYHNLAFLMHTCGQFGLKSLKIWVEIS